MKVVIYNDTVVPGRVHFGCDLVMKTFAEQLKRVDIELIGAIPIHIQEPRGNPLLERADLVIVNGEGSFHSNRRNDIAEVSRYFPSILINTLFHNNDVDLSKFLLLRARESISAKNMGCEIMPDIIFSSNFLHSIKLPEGRKKVGRIRHFSNITTLRPHKKVLEDIVQCSEISSESFHGIAVAHILGIPVTEILDGSGVPWKTHALQRDIVSTENYVSKAKKQIDTFFESLHAIN